MPQTATEDRGVASDGGVARGILAIVAIGVALGVSFNWLGISSRPAWGLAWIGQDKLDTLVALEDLGGADGEVPAAPAGGYVQTDDPMAVGLGAVGGDVPEIPVLDRPIEVQLDAVKKLIDADAALVLDAREPDEFAAGHLPGALSMPYEEVSAEPERLERLDPGGRPIIVYCGGGTCEVSLNLAWDLIYAGHTRVVVHMGGYPEWAEAGYPVEAGAPTEG